MKLLTTEEYYQSLLRAIPRAKKRIVIHAMVVLWGGRTETLLPLVQAALQRGVTVRIVGDIYSRYESKTAALTKRGPHLSWKKTKEVNQHLQGQGAHITYIGKLGLNPFWGRCHSKITIIDDTVYSFGGVNFSNSHFGHADVMLEAVDPALANRLSHLIDNIAKSSRLPDLAEPIDTTATLLFDGGTPGQSIIYKTACSVVATAKKVYYVSKMCPSGRLAKLLRATDYSCYFNRPELEGPPENIAIRFDQIRNNIKNSYRRASHLHAKCILTEDQDGSRHLITGSNNFAWRGIAFGTKEIALHSTDPKLWQACYTFIHQKIA